MDDFVKWISARWSWWPFVLGAAAGALFTRLIAG